MVPDNTVHLSHTPNNTGRIPHILLPLWTLGDLLGPPSSGAKI